MFQNPDWIWLEILVLVLAVLFVAAILGTYIYKRIHHIPTGDCAECRKGSKKLLKEYHKMYSNNKNH